MMFSHRVCSIDEQRKVELTLIDFLRYHCPEIYKLWSTYGDYYVDESEYSDTDDECSSTTDNSSDSFDKNNDNMTENISTHANIRTESSNVSLRRGCHTDYLLSKLGIQECACAPFKLYESQPWLVYWTLQAASLLGITLLLYAHVSRDEIATFLLACLAKVPGRQSQQFTCTENLVSQQERNNTNYNEVETEVNHEEQAMIGFAGSVNGDEPHLASTYAACCALCLLYDETVTNRTNKNNEDAQNKGETFIGANSIDGQTERRGGNPYLHSLPRIAIKRWLLHLRNDNDGSFYVHDGGEADIRASYCVAVIVALLELDNPESFAHSDMHRHIAENEHRYEQYYNSNVGKGDKTSTTSDEYVRRAIVLDERAALFVARCQTHEGGFTCSNDGSEAHGAYTQCGLASLLLMRKPQLINIASARRWLSARQMTFDAGFNGRTNKLVDSCYSYWIGSSHALLRIAECYVKMLNLSADDDDAEHVSSNNVEKCKSCTCTWTRTKSTPFMLAKEILLLDLAQLVDAAQIAVVNNSRWDAAEEEELRKFNMVNEFLRTKDTCLQVTMQHKSRQADAWQVLRENLVSESNTTAPASCAEGISDNKNNNECEDKIRHLNEVNSTKYANVNYNKLRSFLYEEVGDYYYNQRLLQEYVFACCQDIKGGGLKDKPECYPDSYHTCYSLSGVSLAQNLQYSSFAQSTSPYIQRAFARRYLPGKVNANLSNPIKQNVTNNVDSSNFDESGMCDYGVVLPFFNKSHAAETSVLRLTNPLFNIHPRCVRAALQAWTDKTTVESKKVSMFNDLNRN